MVEAAPEIRSGSVRALGRRRRRQSISGLCCVALFSARIPAWP